MAESFGNYRGLARMFSWKGKDQTGQIISGRTSPAVVIRYVIISNKGEDPVGVSLYLNDNNQDILLSPINFQLQPQESYTDRDIVVMDREMIKMNITGGSVDFYFSLEFVEPPLNKK